MTPDPRAALAGALARMAEASDALATHLCDKNIDRYIAATRDARDAFEAVVRAGYERARARRAVTA